MSRALHPFVARPASAGRPRRGRLTRASTAVCLLAMASLLSFPSASSAEVPWHCFKLGEARTPRVLSAELTCLINEMRSARGLHELRPNRQLRWSAARYARRLVSHRLWSHHADGTLGTRAVRSGYTRHAHKFVVGEVLATTNGTLEVWPLLDLMRSPAHRAVLLRRNWQDIGVGAANGQPDDEPGHTLAVTVGRRTGRR